MQYIILLRGVNAGGRNIRMADVKACLEEAGFRAVKTVLQTGNVVLESSLSKDQVKARVGKALDAAFHYPASVLVLEPGELQEAVRRYPFSSGDPSLHRYAVFTEKGSEKQLCRMAGALDDKLERISPGEGVVYWQVVKGHTLDSAFGKCIAKAAAQMFVTNRNLNTLEKILADSQTEK
jgi:uncharacterized protein (DUF1697 family)